jgi:hypothetical protein
MNKTTSLWLISALMSSILQAHAGRPSSPASPTPEPQQTPTADPGSATPPTTPPSSGNTPPADQNTTAQPGFLDTTDGKTTAVIGGLATLGVGAVAAKKGYNYYQQKKRKQQWEALDNFEAGISYFQGLRFPSKWTHIISTAEALSEHFNQHNENDDYFDDREKAREAHDLATTLLQRQDFKPKTKTHLRNIITYLKSKI